MARAVSPTPTPTSTPTPADLDEQAAKLHEYAAGLVRHQADELERDEADFGERFDEAQRAVAAARAAADAATRQADELQDSAQEAMSSAKRFEDDAWRASTDESPNPGWLVDNNRNQARTLRGAAEGLTGRAEEAQAEARRQIEIAERASEEAARIRQAHLDRMDADDTMRLTANSLQQKARSLEQAARDLRRAEHAYDDAERAKLTESAQVNLAEAESIEPDFSGISTEDLVAAGIPLSEVPGAELLDPFAPDPDPVEPEALDLHDTDLLALDPIDPIDPITPAAAAGAPLAGGDPVLGPGSSHLGDDLHDGLMDESLIDLDGPPLGPGDGQPDPLAPVRADLDGAIDPYGDVPAAAGAGDVGDVGDIGDIDVDAVDTPVAVAPASLSADASLDQPDTLDPADSPADVYTDMYFDTYADDTYVDGGDQTSGELTA